MSKYHITKGLYSDIKLPGLLFDVMSIEGIDRYIKDLQQKVNGTATPNHGNQQRHKAYSYMPNISDRSPFETNFTNVWSFLPEHQSKRNGRHDNHATVKPLSLMQRLIVLCTPDDGIVCDLFLGSGTTLISAEKAKRHCYGMELSSMHCDAIIQRWQEHTGQRAQRMEAKSV